MSMDIEDGIAVYVVMGISADLEPEFFGVFNDEKKAWRCAADYGALVYDSDLWPSKALCEEIKQLDGY